MAGADITKLPSATQAVRFREGFGQKFIVTVDTEEEFDWGSPLTRERHSVRTVPALRKFQQFCEGFGVVPIYLIDYPVARSAAAAEVLRDAVAGGRAEIGVQLHPWVNPPFEEAVNQHNSFSGNLSAELEGAKFRLLRDTIETNFGSSPLIYRAGRYGIGPNTAAILNQGGIAIDTSVRSRFDYSHVGGPDFHAHPLGPYWIDEPGGLMELPLTTVYWGPLRQLGGWLYPKLKRAPTALGGLARFGLLERVPLTPEGVTAEEALRGIDIAIDEAVPVLVLSFHSPSLAPGHTPYVRSDSDLDDFYGWWRTVFEYLARRQVTASSVKDIMASVVLA